MYPLLNVLLECSLTETRTEPNKKVALSCGSTKQSKYCLDQ